MKATIVKRETMPSSIPGSARRLAWASAALVLACQPSTPPVAPEPPPAAVTEPETPAVASGESPDLPPPTAPKPIDFPTIEQFVLANGLTVYVVESPKLPLVSARLTIRAGTMDDEQLARLTVDMLGEGTLTRDKAHIDDAIEFEGGTLTASAEMHVSHLTSFVLKKDLKLALTLIADLVQHPLFPEASLQKLKQQRKSELAARRTQADVLADRLFNHVAYPSGHPYGRPLPTDAEVDAITVDDVKRFHQTFYHANTSFLVLAGAIGRAEAEELADRVFGKWQPGKDSDIPPNPLREFRDYPLADKQLVIHLVDRPQATQTEIRVGNLALARVHSEWPALVVANRIFGGDVNSRLFRELREDRGLTYGIYSRISGGQVPGTFKISTDTRTQTTAELLAAIFEHIQRIRSEPPSEAELTTAISELVGHFPLELETTAQITAKLDEQIIFELPPDYWDGYRDAIGKVTVAQAHEAARKYIHGSPHVVLVGQASAIEPQLTTLLPTAIIKRYDEKLVPR